MRRGLIAVAIVTLLVGLSACGGDRFDTNPPDAREAEAAGESAYRTYDGRDPRGGERFLAVSDWYDLPCGAIIIVDGFSWGLAVVRRTDDPSSGPTWSPVYLSATTWPIDVTDLSGDPVGDAEDEVIRTIRRHLDGDSPTCGF